MKKMMIILTVWSCCFLFVGCSIENRTSSNDNAGNEITMENGFEEMENKLSDIEPIADTEPIVEDNWPDNIGRENVGLSAEELSFEIEISNPMVLAIVCVTESGKLDMKIQNDDGEEIFSESDIQIENFEVNINSSGTYKVIIQADKHVGSFWIKPQK